jgi:hypothetical protein
VLVLMATGTKRDQILGAIMPETAARLLMMDFEIPGRATILTTPTIPPENGQAELFIRFRVELYARSFWPQSRHGVASIPFRKSDCIACGSKL